MLASPDNFLTICFSSLVSSVRASSVAPVGDERGAEAWTWCVRRVYMGGDPGKQEWGSKESEAVKMGKPQRVVLLSTLTLWATGAQSGCGP